MTRRAFCSTPGRTNRGCRWTCPLALGLKEATRRRRTRTALHDSRRATSVTLWYPLFMDLLLRMDSWSPTLQAYAVLFLLITLGPGVATAQTTPADTTLQAQALEQVREAFARGDARALLAHATERIEMTLLGRSTHFSRSQAIYVMEEFFRDYPPEQFAAEETSGGEGNWFMAYEYWSTRGQEPMQVFIRVRTFEDSWEVQEIRVERLRR